MIKKLTQEQIVDSFAKYQPDMALDLPLDPVKCLWFYFTIDELAEQLQHAGSPGDPFDQAKFDAWMWMDKVVRQRRDAWLEHGNISDVIYTEILK